jgi:hypothetical protein
MTHISFLYGAVAMGCVIVGVFFLRFWQQLRDSLFLWFACAFWILAISYTLLGVLTFATEWRVYVFAVRLLAFCTILYGIFEKNRR